MITFIGIRVPHTCMEVDGLEIPCVYVQAEVDRGDGSLERVRDVVLYPAVRGNKLVYVAEYIRGSQGIPLNELDNEDVKYYLETVRRIGESVGVSDVVLDKLGLPLGAVGEVDKQHEADHEGEGHS